MTKQLNVIAMTDGKYGSKEFALWEGEPDQDKIEKAVENEFGTDTYIDYVEPVGALNEHQRYALTYKQEAEGTSEWASSDTIIFTTTEPTLPEGEGLEKMVEEVLVAYGVSEADAKIVVNEGWFFLRHFDDIDVALGEK